MSNEFSPGKFKFAEGVTISAHGSEEELQAERERADEDPSNIAIAVNGAALLAQEPDVEEIVAFATGMALDTLNGIRRSAIRLGEDPDPLHIGSQLGKLSTMIVSLTNHRPTGDGGVEGGLILAPILDFARKASEEMFPEEALMAKMLGGNVIHKQGMEAALTLAARMVRHKVIREGFEFHSGLVYLWASDSRPKKEIAKALSEGKTPEELGFKNAEDLLAQVLGPDKDDPYPLLMLWAFDGLQESRVTFRVVEDGETYTMVDAGFDPNELLQFTWYENQEGGVKA